MKRKTALLLSLILLTGGLTACGGNTAQTSQTSHTAQSAQSADGQSADSGEVVDDHVFKIGYGGGLCEAPLHVAVDKGYFDKVGLKYELVRCDAAETASYVGSGKLEAGFGLLGKFLQPIDNGLPMRVTAGLHTGCTKVLAPADSGIKTVADLKGKKIGVPGLGAAPAIIVRRSLAAVGVDSSPEAGEVEFAVFAMSDLAAALENGAVDAVAMSDPQGSVAEAEYGLNCIIDTATDDEYKDEYCCISFVTDTIAKEHPEVAKNYTKAMMEAALWVQANPDEAAKLQVENNWVSGDAEFNASVLKQYNYKPSLQGGLEALKLSAPALQEIGLIKDTTNIDDFVNNTFYEIEGLTDEEVFADAGVDAADIENSAEEKKDAAASLTLEQLKAAEALDDCCKEEEAAETEEKDCCKEKHEQETKKDCCEE